MKLGLGSGKKPASVSSGFCFTESQWRSRRAAPCLSLVPSPVLKGLLSLCWHEREGLRSLPQQLCDLGPAGELQRELPSHEGTVVASKAMGRKGVSRGTDVRHLATCRSRGRCSVSVNPMVDLRGNRPLPRFVLLAVVW